MSGAFSGVGVTFRSPGFRGGVGCSGGACGRGSYNDGVSLCLIDTSLVCKHATGKELPYRHPSWLVLDIQNVFSS